MRKNDCSGRTPRPGAAREGGEKSGKMRKRGPDRREVATDREALIRGGRSGGEGAAARWSEAGMKVEGGFARGVDGGVGAGIRAH